MKVIVSIYDKKKNWIAQLAMSLTNIPDLVMDEVSRGHFVNIFKADPGEIYNLFDDRKLK